MVHALEPQPASSPGIFEVLAPQPHVGRRRDVLLDKSPPRVEKRHDEHVPLGHDIQVQLLLFSHHVEHCEVQHVEHRRQKVHTDVAPAPLLVRRDIEEPVEAGLQLEKSRPPQCALAFALRLRLAFGFGFELRCLCFFCL